MSMTPEFTDAGKFFGRNTGKVPEKLNFSMTCNLLSQYLREKGSFRDLSLGTACNQEGKGFSGKSDPTVFRPPTTMSLLPEMEVSGRVSHRPEDFSDPKPALWNVKSMDLFPQHAGFGPSISNENAEKINTESSDPRRGKTEPATAQMTIFYGGKVVVFDEFPADKVQAIMDLASNVETFNNNNPSAAVSTSTNSNALKTVPQINSSDLPIARKASLHRFLEKRKDRISARAPYKVTGSAGNPEPEANLTSTSFPWLANDKASQQLKPYPFSLTRS